MYWQREHYRTSRSMTLNNTDTLELPKTGRLGSILIKLSGAQASGLGQSGGSWRLIDYISKIEVIGDGATVIKSFSAKELAGLLTRDQGVIPPASWRNYATNTQYQYLLINFGRKLWDKLFLLDLGRFNTVELKVTNTAAAAQFSDVTETVELFWLRDYGSVASPLGYLRTEEWKKWTTVQAETKYNELPTELAIRSIFLQATPPVDADNVEKTNMANLMYNVRLALKTGEVDVYNAGIELLMRENYLEFGRPLLTFGDHYMNADKGVDISLGYVMGGAWGAGSQDGAGAAVIATMETGRTSFTQKPETYEADSPQGFLFAGVAPFMCVWFAFDDDPDPATWLDPEANKVVKLDIQTRDSSSAVGGTNAIILDRLVRY